METSSEQKMKAMAIKSNILTIDESPLKFAISVSGKFHPVDFGSEMVDTSKCLDGPIDFMYYRNYGRTHGFTFYVLKKKYMKDKI